MLRILAVTNMYPTPQNPDSGTFVEQQIQGLKQIGLDVQVMVLDRAQKGMSVYLGLGREVRAKVADFQPDLVHVVYGGVMADMVTRAVNDRPTIVSFCGDDLLGELLSGSLRKFIARYGVLASHWATRRASGIVVKSKNLQDALPSYVPRSKVRVIPNGINLDRFKPLEREKCRALLGWSRNSFHVLIPSGHPIKRPELARAAVDAVERSGVEVELHIMGGVPHDRVPFWLNASDVLLLTSLHEGSPNIVKEALACDLPVVSVDVGDVEERTHGIDGCYIALPEPHELAAKLSLVSTGARRVKGRAKIQHLSVERVALQLKEFYDELLLSWRRNGACGFLGAK